MDQNVKNHGRVELKKLFENGNIPTENDFGFLIDSTINKQDDGFRKDEEDGLVVVATNDSKKLISFYKNMDETEPYFSIDLYDKGKGALKLSPFISKIEEEKIDNEENGKSQENASKTASQKNKSSFFFHTEGRLGIGKTTEKNFVLDVNGFTASHGRIGTFKSGCVPADGKWHPVIKDLNNCQAFEIVARTGLARTGLFAILHAFALSAFGGKSKSKIRKTCAYYGFCWNKINVKWVGKTHSYALMLRTNRNYGKNAEGKDVNIYYNITKLWDDENFMPQEYFYQGS